MDFLKPRALRFGDRVAVVAPASPFPRDEFDAGLDEIRALGFEPVIDDSVFHRRAYLAGDAATRARALVAAWTDESIRAILTARGGYGSAQLLPLLSRDLLRATPKLLVGYSDITALLSFVTTRCQIVAVHGPTVTGRFGGGAGAYDRESFLRTVMEPHPFGAVMAPEIETIAPGEAAGPLCGGNLTQLAASLGTPFGFDPPQGCVLFLEDVNERPYRIDRLLTQMRHAGILARAAAIVFGEMPGCDEADGAVLAKDAAADVVSALGVPVLWGLRSGHATGPAITLPLGVRARVVAGSHPAVIVEEAAVVA